MERLPASHRKAKILKEALNILLELGARGLTMRNLARRVGLSEAGLYRHFRDKEEIVRTVAQKTCDPSLVPELKKEEPLAALEKLMQKQLQKLNRIPQLAAVSFQEELFREYPTVEEELQEHRREKEKLIISLVEKGQVQGIFKPDLSGEVFALIFMGSMRLAVLQWKESGFTYSLPKQGEKIMAVLTRLLKEEEK